MKELSKYQIRTCEILKIRKNKTYQRNSDEHFCQRFEIDYLLALFIYLFLPIHLGTESLQEPSTHRIHRLPSS